MTLEELFLKSYDLTEAERKALDKRMIAEYQKALGEIDKRLKEVHLNVLSGVKKEDYYNEMVKFNRLKKLSADIQKDYLKAANNVGSLQKEAAELSISNLYYRQLYAIDWTQTTNQVFTVLPRAVIEASVYGSQEAWRLIADEYGDPKAYLPQSGTLLEAVMKKNKAVDLQALESKLTQALIQGKGYRATVKDIKDVMETSTAKAMRIAATEGHRNMMAGNYAMTNIARENGVDVKRKILSVLDLKTRPQSVQVDGLVENDDGYFIYPDDVRVRIPGNSGVARWDINDRESVVNIVDGEGPELRRARNPVTGKNEIIDFQSYEQWAKDNNLKKLASGKWVPK